MLIRSCCSLSWAIRLAFVVECLIHVGGLAAGELPRVDPETFGMSSAELEEADRIVEGLISDKKMAAGAAAIAGYGKGGGAVQDEVSQSAYRKFRPWLSGGGGMVSTTRDYLRFLVMIQSGGELGGLRLLKKRTVEMMTRNQLPPKAMPVAFGDAKRGCGIWTGILRPRGDERLGSRWTSGRIRMGRSRQHTLLGVAQGRLGGGDHGADRALFVPFRVGGKGSHL